MRKAMITFPEGDYGAALTHYAQAKELMLYGGLCFHPGIDGLIKSPEFKGQQVPGYTIPNEWIDEPGWRCRVEIACLNPDAVKAVHKLKLPAGAQMSWEEANRTRSAGR